eukprot:m.243675 g.243675  ORF g.243675 m.243675 type:complete len:512 (+) comp19024_c1_seq3:79-1614(+)
MPSEGGFYRERGNGTDSPHLYAARNPRGTVRSETTPLLGKPAPSGSNWTRWYILTLYSFLNGLQGLNWMTYSSVPEPARNYLHTSNSTLDLLLNEGPIGYVSMYFFSSWLLAQPRGLAISIRLGAYMCLFASLVRCVPCLFSDGDRQEHHVPLMATVHLGQIVNACVAPFIQASPALLSMVWFPPRERNTVTAVANASNAVGRAIGFFLGPALVKHASQLPVLLALEIGLAVLPALAVTVYLPARPAVAPSASAREAFGGVAGGVAAAATKTPASAAAMTTPSSTPSHSYRSFRSVLQDMGHAMALPSFAALVIAYGLQMGVYCSWASVLPMQESFSATKAGWLASANTFAGIVGGVLCGYVTDHPALARRLKAVMLVLCVITAILFGTFALTLPPFHVVNHLPYSALMAIATTAGLFRGGLDPLFFELGTDITHPLGAGTVGASITVTCHVALIIALSVPSHTLVRYASSAMTVAMVLSFVSILFVREQYNRRDIDEADADSHTSDKTIQ